MKALSIKQPWAALIAHGIKDVENRSRRTSYRGKILLHASAKGVLAAGKQYYDILTDKQRMAVIDAKKQGVFLAKAWQNGAIIGEAEIVDCVNNSTSIWAEEGQWHWVIANPKLYTFDEIILDVKGKLGIWEYENYKI